jgi:HD-GYP domain-containing protein (c-di-GMP phosphodiesterase class II)
VAAVLGPGTAVAKPRLKVVAHAPLTVRGTGFVRHESVRVRLVMPDSEMVRRVRATRRGRFSVRFTRAAPDRCAGYAVVASGDAGSFVTLRWPARPGCPPALARAPRPAQVRGAAAENVHEAMRLIRLSSLTHGMVLARDLRTGRPGEIPLLRAGVPLSDAYIRRLQATSLHTVWIDDDLSGDIEPLEPLDPEMRIAAEEAVHESFDRTTRVLASGGTSLPEHDLDRLTSTVSQIATSLADVPEAALALGDLATADAYTHRHSVQVAIIGMLIARRLWQRDGWRDWMERPRFDGIEGRLTRLGVGLILHDIGKLAVPIEILNKRGALTADELRQVKLHPTAGVDLLLAADPSPRVLATVRDHHERLDGSGYPAGRDAETIHEFARICAIADVFDAVSSERPYKHAAPAHVAVNVIGDGVHRGRFDPRVVAAFRRVCMPFPLGSEVVVDGKPLGVVSKVDADEPWMPTVRRIEKGEIAEVAVDLRHLDALRYPSGKRQLEAA